MVSNLERARPPALPQTADDWRNKRITKPTITLNDLVETQHFKLVGNATYSAYLYAVHDSQAVEGSQAADNFMAAQILRESAKEDEVAELARQNLTTINKALGVVLRRFGESRKQRRNMVGGEIIPNGDEAE